MAQGSVKYSIIIPYRDRLDHLKVLLPRLAEWWQNALPNNHEVIVVEQDNDDIFRRGNMRNAGAQAANGEYLIFHDVDYYPKDLYAYWDVHQAADVFLPVKRVNFVYNNLAPKPVDEIPGGYRHFAKSVDDNFFGGVLTFKRDAFFKIGGFNPLYRGWGFEDADLRQRCEYYQLSMRRNDDSLFLALDHEDSGPKADDTDFRQNIAMCSNWLAHITARIDTYQQPTVRSVTPELFGVDQWLKVTDIDPVVHTGIVASAFDFDDE